MIKDSLSLIYKVFSPIDKMKTLIYVRASTKEQDAERVLNDLIQFSEQLTSSYQVFSENISGTKLERPALNNLMGKASEGDILLVESIDRLSRLSQADFEILKTKIKAKGLKLVVMDLPTTHQLSRDMNDITDAVMGVINNLLIDLFATMARLDNDKRKERIKQGLARVGYKPTGKKANTIKHNQIKRHLADAKLTKEEIAKLVDCGVATVYRVARALNKDS